MLAYLFVLFAIAIRFMPHPWSFTPVAASLLFFGARGSRRMTWLPLVLLAASDVGCAKFLWAIPFSLSDNLVIWAWYAAILWLGTKLRDHQKPLPIMGAALAGSVSFFLASNFAVWAMQSMYPKNLGGLMLSYTLGLPFFRRSLEGDLLFTIAMFATPVVLQSLTRVFSKGGKHPAAA